MNQTEFDHWKEGKMNCSANNAEGIKIYTDAWAKFNAHRDKVIQAGLIKYHPNDYPKEYKELKTWPPVPIIKEPKKTLPYNTVYTGNRNPFEEEPFISMDKNKELMDSGHCVVDEVDDKFFTEFKKYGLGTTQTTIFNRDKL